MICPDCKLQTHITDSRPNLTGTEVRRRHECKVCRGRFTTIEVRVEGNKYQTVMSEKLSRSARALREIKELLGKVLELMEELN